MPLVIACNNRNSTSLTANVLFNQRQRIVVVIEGANERVASVIRYLRSHGVDISLLEYRYYQTEGGEEILDIEQRVGAEQAVASRQSTPRYTEERLFAEWSEDVITSYKLFRDWLLQQETIIVFPQKSVISFYKQTHDGRVFICLFNRSSRGAYINFRLDSLQDRLDVAALLETIESTVSLEVQINRGNVWWALHYPTNKTQTNEFANLIIEGIVNQVD